MIAWFNEQLGGVNPKFVLLYNNRNIRRKQPADIILAFRTFCDSIGKEKAKMYVNNAHSTKRPKWN